MAIDAVFEHVEGYKFNEVYLNKRKFLTCLKRIRNAAFLHAVDYETQYVVYPSNLPDYINSSSN